MEIYFKTDYNTAAHFSLSISNERYMDMEAYMLHLYISIYITLAYQDIKKKFTKLNNLQNLGENMLPIYALPMITVLKQIVSFFKP